MSMYMCVYILIDVCMCLLCMYIEKVLKSKLQKLMPTNTKTILLLTQKIK